MRVLLCERSFSGHRKSYFQRLSDMEGIEFYSFAPENTGLPDNRYFAFDSSKMHKSFADYLSWVRQVRKIVKENRIDVLHLTDGDSVMRYLGIGLHIPDVRVIVTYHHLFKGAVRRLSYRLMNAGKSHCCVVHTDVLKTEMKKIGVSNVIRCHYPAFDFDAFEKINSRQCKARFGLDEGVPVIGIIGGMTAYKHIIPFLNILRECTRDFRLLICGSPSELSEQAISEAIAPYRKKVVTVLRKLNDEEYRAAVAASDIIYCLYGLNFNGASGPLTDGVCCRKLILSCSHGSLGDIVSTYHLGLTADITNSGAILRQTESALSQALDFRYDDSAEKYRECIKPEAFAATYKKIYLGNVE